MCSARQHIQVTPWDIITDDHRDPVIHNIVSTSTILDRYNLGNVIPLQIIADSLPCCKYDRSQFAAMTIRISSPNCTALLFTTGKLVVTGANNWYESLLSAMHVADLVSTVFFNQKYAANGCVMQNVVAHTALDIPPGKLLDLQGMYTEMALECTYQPSMFPGLSYRPIDLSLIHI